VTANLKNESISGFDASLWINHAISPLVEHLKDDCTDLAIIGPNLAFVDGRTGWRKVPFSLDMNALKSLAKTIAKNTNQSISEQNPIMSAMLPNRERIQIVMPPAVASEQFSISVRRPSINNFPVSSYVESGYFKNTVWKTGDGFGSDHQVFIEDAIQDDGVAGTELTGVKWLPSKNNIEKIKLKAKNDPLIGQAYELLSTGRIADFLMFGIKQKFTMAMVGDTGSGKTALMRSLCSLIPLEERLISIEDVRELFLPHDNFVNLMYSKGMQGQADVSVSDLIANCMRMKPDRVLLAELRGSESYDFLKLMTSGHAGSVTSYHAVNCASAIPRFVFMAKESKEAASYDMEILRKLFLMSIDVIAHVKAVPLFNATGEVIGKKRVMTEIYWDPILKEGVKF